jgi:formylmethanofuran dehydrogenase subunit E
MHDIEKLLHEYRLKAIPYSRAKSHRVYLEEYKKSLLSLLLKDAERKGFASVSAQERESYSRPEYVKHLEALRDSVEAEEHQRFEIKRIELEIEVWRTHQANERMERKAYGA